MIIMKGELTGQVAVGCYEVLIMAYGDTPNVIGLYGHQAMLGSIETTMGVKNYRLEIGEDLVVMEVPCTPEEYEMAMQCERWFTVRPDESGVTDMPPLLRPYAQQVVDLLRQQEAGK